MRSLSASLVVIGDEILGGFIRDENVGWLAARLRAHGVDLRRVAVVPDDHREIGLEIRAALSRRRPHLVLTTGGIGSTPDDITYEAVAQTLGRELVVAPEIAVRIERIIDWTREQGVDVDEDFAGHLMRMARVPEGSQTLREAGGWMPGVRVDVDGGIDAEGATVVVLPGVPEQLRTIVSGVIEPDLLEGRGAPESVAEVTHRFPESALNRCFARLGQKHPDVRVGSYPGDPMLVRLRGAPEEVACARADLEAYIRDLEEHPGGARLRDAWAERVSRSAEDAEACS
jgi:nicotinamide-nucleotide amidase